MKISEKWNQISSGHGKLGPQRRIFIRIVIQLSVKLVTEFGKMKGFLTKSFPFPKKLLNFHLNTLSSVEPVDWDYSISHCYLKLGIILTWPYTKRTYDVGLWLAFYNPDAICKLQSIRRTDIVINYHHYARPSDLRRIAKIAASRYRSYD